MELSFAKAKLRKLCTSSSELIQRYGPRQGRMILDRLNELEAAPTLAAAKQIPHLHVHQLTGDRAEQFAVTVVQPYRLIVSVADDPVPRRHDGGIDIAGVRAVTILEIVNYH